MRLKARETLTYGGVEYMGGSIFDASDADGQYLINQDMAIPFNLEDPSTIPAASAAAPEALTVPPQPAAGPSEPEASGALESERKRRKW